MDNNVQFVKESAPHIRRKDSINRMMLDVVIGLLPVIIYAFIFSPLQALRNVLCSVLTMELCEFVFVLIQNRIPYDGTKHTLKEQFVHGLKAYKLSDFMVPLVSALIYALISPTDMEQGYFYLMYPALITGAVFGLVIGKLVFGGTGNNIFNPALVGMIFSKICFGSHYAYWNAFQQNTTGSNGVLVDAGATSLSGTFVDVSNKTFNITGEGSYSLLDLFLGRIPGLFGEVCKVAILIGFVYMVIRHAIDWRITLSYVGTFFVMMLIAGLIISSGKNATGVNPFYFATYQMLSGGLLFGAVFMATDPVTSPITQPGRVLYGVILAVCTTFIRLFASLPEGVGYSILIGNMMTSVIDYPKWSTNKWNWKNILVPVLVFVVFALIMVWALCVEVLG